MSDIKHPARMGQKWTDDEVIKLLSSIQSKKSIKDIAAEHERTVGAINAQRRRLAADYWFNDKKPIDEICILTGLTKDDIEEAIHRRATSNTSKPPKKVKLVTKDHLDDEPTDMKEVIALLKDIKELLSALVDKVQ